MKKELQIQLYKLLSALSLAMDYNRSGLMRHHQRVALLSLALAEKVNMDENEKTALYCSALVHDAGTSTFSEKALLEHFEVVNPWQHCERGYTLLKKAGILAPLAQLVLHHHDRWDGVNNISGLKGNSIPLSSRILFLADRIDVLTKQPGNILDHRENIIKKIIAGAGIMFDPDLVDIFVELARKECFWLDLSSLLMESRLKKRMGKCPVIAGQDEIIGISLIFADIIDGKSPFTHRHSRLVAEVANLIASKLGYPEQKRKNIYVAGLLHDLGKLSIPEEILEKPTKLTRTEYNIIKQHTYITYQILDMIDGFEEIKEWASYHHEKLNGEGYPFHLERDELSTGARIMAVADIFSALVEERPYRKGLPRNKVEKIMRGMVESRSIDGEILNLLMENYQEAIDLPGVTNESVTA